MEILRYSLRRFRTMPATVSGLLLALSIILINLFLFLRLPVPSRKAETSVPENGSQVRVATAYGKLPIRFESNEGQVDSQVKFIARGRGYSLYLTPGGSLMSLKKPETREHRPDSSAAPTVIQMHLANSNPSPQITRGEELPGITNYLIGNDPEAWRTNIKSYNCVQFEDVYPGIDLIYHGNQQELEYDFEVRVGSDPDRIEMAIDGVERFEIDAEGQLVLHTSTGEVIQRRPIAYQQLAGIRKEVPVSYVLTAHNTVRFHTSPYDINHALVIDPVLVYSTYLGGNAYDWAGDIAVDSEGNAYISGQTNSPNFPIASAFQRALSSTDYDAFVLKLNPSGSQLVYSTYLGGNALDAAHGIAIDSKGNAYITGRTNSPDFPATIIFRGSFTAGIHAFVTKLNPFGNGLIYSAILGGDNTDQGEAIAVDADGNAYVLGDTASTNFPVVNAFQPGSAGGEEVFVTKVNPSGTALIYSTYLGGSNHDLPGRLAVDSSGNAYVTGLTESTDFPVANAFQPSTGGGVRSAFVTKLDASGSALVYSTYLGGSKDEVGAGIAVDSNGSAYITGYTASSNFPLANAFQAKLAGNSDAFLTKLDTSGSLEYSTYFGGNGNESGSAVALDLNGNIYVTGYTSSTNLAIADAAQSSYGGGPQGTLDAFVTEFDASGKALLYSTYVGGNAGDSASGVAVDSNGSAYVTGYTVSPNFPVVNALEGVFHPCTPPVFTIPSRPATCSDGDAFVAKIALANVSPSSSAPTLNFINPATGLAGTTVLMTLSGTGFSTGMTVTAGNGITVSNIRVLSPTAGTATFVVAANATGLTDVTVTTSTGTSNAMKFTISPSGLTAFEPQSIVHLQAGFYIAEATLAQNASSGVWGLEVLGQISGGFNLGGALSSAMAGFGAFYVPTVQTVTATAIAPFAPTANVTLRLLDSNHQPIGANGSGAGAAYLQAALQPGFYIAELTANSAAPLNYVLALSADSFSGGVDVGGYIATGITGFGAFYIPLEQDVSIRLFGRNTYGSVGAGSLVLTLRDANRNVIQQVAP